MGGYLRAEIGFILTDVDPCADDDAGEFTALRLPFQLRQDAAELFPVQHQIIGPLDAGADAADGLHRVAKRYGGPGCQGADFRERALGAEGRR